ncbi:MAG: hypothetical protein ACE5EF_08965, partial [Dehalococcoidia bacterium]
MPAIHTSPVGRFRRTTIELFARASALISGGHSLPPPAFYAFTGEEHLHRTLVTVGHLSAKNGVPSGQTLVMEVAGVVKVLIIPGLTLPAVSPTDVARIRETAGPGSE